MQFLYPDWPAPAHIRTAVTLVPSGLDLSLHNTARASHEQQLVRVLALPRPPVWLNQVHGNKVVLVEQLLPNIRPEADAGIAEHGNNVLAVLTADCLPILLSDVTGQQIAAIHAGWRGQVVGIIEETVRAMNAPAKKLLAWFGPAIGPAVYEVGSDVYEQVMRMSCKPLLSFFKPNGENKWLMNLYAIARFKLQQLGVLESNIFGGEWCTYSEPRLFYSYRRTKTSKRMATLIWFED